jgi:hypothetical protein
MSRVLMSLFVGSVLSGCGLNEAEPRQGRLELRAGQSVSGGDECGVNLPGCAQGRSCIAFTVAGVSQARCLDDATVCTELLSCTGGTQCLILESYPARVTCSGRCEGEDCDVSVSSPAP